jgi:hypothetical protein
MLMLYLQCDLAFELGTFPLPPRNVVINLFPLDANHNNLPDNVIITTSRTTHTTQLRKSPTGMLLLLDLFLKNVSS